MEDYKELYEKALEENQDLLVKVVIQEKEIKELNNQIDNLERLLDLDVFSVY